MLMCGGNSNLNSFSRFCLMMVYETYLSGLISTPLSLKLFDWFDIPASLLKFPLSRQPKFYLMHKNGDMQSVDHAWNCVFVDNFAKILDLKHESSRCGI